MSDQPSVAELRTRVQAGDLQAAALLGLWELLGHNVDRDLPAGVRRLTDAASRGHVEACAFLATLHATGFGVPLDWQRAGRWLIAAAQLGNDRALTQLALLVSEHETDLRVRLLYAASVQGSAIAPYFLGKSSLALADERARRAGDAWMAIAVTRGNPLATSFAQPLPGVPPLAPGPQLPADFWERVATAFDPARFLAPLSVEVHRTDPHVASARAALTPALCDYIIGLAAPLLTRAEVNDVVTGSRVHEMRTNWQARFALTNTDVIGVLAARRVAQLAGEPFENQEDTMILRYRPGEAYEDHFDFVDPRVPAFAHELATRGQRIATVLVYLNDGYTDGYTEFPQLQWRYRGAPGDALIFRSVTARGEPDPRTLHAGRPPQAGEKWILSKWLRDRPQLGRIFS
jgi:hypothetical protein